MTAGSALYVGSVMHRRRVPRHHEFRYRAFWLLLDLDELGRRAHRLRFFSVDRLNLFGFRPRDHGDGTLKPLREQIESQLAAAGIDIAGGAIKLLCMPRILGYGFNPLSIYFCYRADGMLAALVHEVRNTFGGRHAYVASVEPSTLPVRHDCHKVFYVSPFLDMGLRYAFRVTPPAERLAVVIRADGPAGPVLDACLSGSRRDLTDGALLGVFFTIPFVTLKTTLAIHWEALRLWWKGVPTTLSQAGRESGPVIRH